MAKKQKSPCPLCGKPDSDGRHIRLCPKNPKRMKGVNIKEMAAPKEPQGSAPQIVAKVEPVQQKDLPNFTPPVQAKEAQKQTVPPEAQVASSVVVQPFVDLACNAFNQRLQVVTGGGAAVVPPSPDPISEDERKALAQVYGALADKYFPMLMAKWGLEAAAVILTLTVFGKRIWDWWDYRTFQKKQAEAKQHAQGEAAPSFRPQAQMSDGGLPIIVDPVLRGSG